MPDQLASGILKRTGIRWVIALTSELSKDARDLHHAKEAAALILAQGLTAAALYSSLNKEKARVHLQLECDGPLRGLFVDTDGEGTIRGYVKNSDVEFQGASAEYRFRPIFGNKGFLSVLRDPGHGEFYRSSVELVHFDLTRDLEHYLATSEQVASSLALETVPSDKEPLDKVAGLLLQSLPGESPPEPIDVGAFREAIGVEPLTAASLAHRLWPSEETEVFSRYPLVYQCGCSKERVVRALIALGPSELEDILIKEGKVEATCEFCMTLYVVSGEEIRALLAQLAADKS